MTTLFAHFIPYLIVAGHVGVEPTYSQIWSPSCTIIDDLLFSALQQHKYETTSSDTCISRPYTPTLPCSGLCLAEGIGVEPIRVSIPITGFKPDKHANFATFLYSLKNSISTSNCSANSLRAAIFSSISQSG